MEFTYKNRKHIARFTIALLILILILLLIFKMSRGTYSIIINNIIVNQTKELEHCILPTNDNRENVKVVLPRKHLYNTDFLNIIIYGFVLLVFIHFIWIFRSKFFYGKKYTPVSLCVRMDE